jgi:hydroxymethylglutaryl-CoA lyase
MNVSIVEVGPRDGLQNESQTLTLEQKLQFIKLLAEAGHTNIEAGAFVRADKIPQMADSKELLKKLPKSKKIRYWSLVPNEHGFKEAFLANVTNIAIFTASSETFNQKNINTSIAGSFERFQTFVPVAKKNDMKVRGYISTAFGCPYEGKINPKAVLKVAEGLMKLGCDEISVGDTIGVANPVQVKALSKSLLKSVGAKKLAMHFHDTRGTALANVLASLETGIRTFDSSSGGLGGCPYAPGASGNVATDDLVYMLESMGIKTGINLSKQVKASEFVQRILGRVLPSKYLQAAMASNT